MGHFALVQNVRGGGGGGGGGGDCTSAECPGGQFPLVQIVRGWGTLCTGGGDTFRSYTGYVCALRIAH